MAGRDKPVIGYRVWFEGESAPRSRRFVSRTHACRWALVNQSARPYELAEERRGRVVRRLVRRLRKT